MIRVSAARNELRGLFIARNELAAYLTPPPPDEDERHGPPEPTMPVPPSSQLVALDQRPRLPPAIDDERSCKRCFVVDACMLYRRAIDGATRLSDDDDNPLQSIFAAKTEHLSDAHAAFFRHWERLIAFEERELAKYRREIWTMTAREREETGRCLAGMVVDRTFDRRAFTAASGTGSDRYDFHRHLFRLRRADRSTLHGHIVAGDPLVVSLVEPDVLALATGFVLEMATTHIVIGIDHDITELACTDVSERSTFRIDKDELTAGMGRVRDNLAQLFYAQADDRLRRLVVDLERPYFARSDTEGDAPMPSQLNGDQRKAVDKALSARDYVLILGMPGTGKTTTIAELIRCLVARAQTVLLTSYTHSAVDNILLKLIAADPALPVLRLGNVDKIMPAVRHLALDAQSIPETLAAYEARIHGPRVVATTALSVNQCVDARM